MMFIFERLKTTMQFFDLLVLAIGLSMDAFAVSICKGITLKDMNLRKSIIIGIYFGVFQALMPFLGFILTGVFSEQIKSFDHWIAFGLLLFIGIKMLIEAFEEKKEEECCEHNIRFFVMIPLALATSIDALAAGITLSINEVNIYYAIAIIGAVTFLLCTIGAKVGNYFGRKFQKLAEIFGGIILILLGIKILFSDLGLFSIQIF